MKSVFNGAGHLFADNRASDWGGVEESDLLGCKHCQALIKAHEWRAEGAFCHHCGGPICASCAGIGGCTPFEQRLEQAISDHYRRQQNARILGI